MFKLLFVFLSYVLKLILFCISLSFWGFGDKIFQFITVLQRSLIQIDWH
jgi:hypothetical protein